MIGFDLTCFSDNRSGIAKVAFEYARAFQGQSELVFYLNIHSRRFIKNPDKYRVIFTSKLKYLNSLLFLPLWTRIDHVTTMVFFNHRIPFFISRKTAVIIFVHDLVHLKHPKTMRLSTRLLDRFFFRRGCKKAEKIVCVSKSTACELVNEFPWCSSKISVIHPLLDKSPVEASGNFLSHLPSGRTKFVSIGSFEPRKNYARLLLAFSAVSKLNSKWSLTLVGSHTWGTEPPEGLIRQLNLGHRVVVKRDVGEDELAGILESSDCLIQPSIYEGFGLPVLEAIRFALPVLVSEKGAPVEIVGEPLLTFDPLDVESIATAIIAFMGLSESEVAVERTRMKRRSDELSWEDSVCRLKRLISQQ